MSLIQVAIAVVAVVVVGVVALKKFKPEVFTSLVERVTGGASKGAAVVSPAPAITPVQTAAPQAQPTFVKAFESMTRAEWDAWRNEFVASTREFIPTWERKLEIDRMIREAAAQPGVNRVGFDMNLKNGFIAYPSVASGEPHAYTYPYVKGHVIRVIPLTGSQVLSVNKQKVHLYAVLENPPADGSMVLEVEYIGAGFAVTYQPL